MSNEARLQEWIDRHGVEAVLVRYPVSCHTVEEAAAATGAGVEGIIKNICMIGPDDELIVAILPGADRASTRRVGKALGMDPPRVATPEEVLARTGFPAGGTPSFGFAAHFVVDPRVLERDEVHTGGGSDRALVRIAPSALVAANQAVVARVRK